MPKSKSTNVPDNTIPAKSAKELEDAIILEAYNKVRERISNGTASSAEYVHFLKLGSSMEKLNREKQKHEIELMKVKTESIEREKNIEKLYQQAIDARKTYWPKPESDDEEDDRDA